MHFVPLYFFSCFPHHSVLLLQRTLPVEIFKWANLSPLLSKEGLGVVRLHRVWTLVSAVIRHSPTFWMWMFSSLKINKKKREGQK